MCAPEFGAGEKIQGLAVVSCSRHSRIEPIARAAPNSARERRASDVSHGIGAVIARDGNCASVDTPYSGRTAMKITLGRQWRPTPAKAGSKVARNARKFRELVSRFNGVAGAPER